MNEKVKKAIGVAVELCTKCGKNYSCVECGAESPINHDDDCPIRTIEDCLASLDEPKGETVKVRIAVAVSATGEWSASGWSEQSDEESSIEAWNSVPKGARRYFVEADIPLPKPSEPQTIQGTVEADKKKK